MIPCDAYSSCKLYRFWLTVLVGRNGAGDTTSSSNIGEEYHTSERMVNTLFVYMLNRHGQPLMPCQPRKARHLLKAGKAKVVKMIPFTIQLLFGSSGYKQEVTLGVDAGTRYLGVSATTEKKVLLDAHVKTIKLVHKLLPVSKTTLEVAQFDIQKLRNPEIAGKEYQEGLQLGFWNVREYVLFRDNHCCQWCKGKSKDLILNVHHIESRKTGGDSPDNLITLCEACHDLIHQTHQEHKITRKSKRFRVLAVFFYIEMEDQVFTWSSMFSCDTSPVYTTQVLISRDQKSHLVFRISSVYLCQFVADVAFRRCSIRYWTFLESRCSLTSNLVRRSEGRHARIYGPSSST
jgi:hypothetical protein